MFTNVYFRDKDLIYLLRMFNLSGIMVLETKSSLSRFYAFPITFHLIKVSFFLGFPILV